VEPLCLRSSALKEVPNEIHVSILWAHNDTHKLSASALALGLEGIASILQAPFSMSVRPEVGRLSQVKS